MGAQCYGLHDVAAVAAADPADSAAAQVAREDVNGYGRRKLVELLEDYGFDFFNEDAEAEAEAEADASSSQPPMRPQGFGGGKVTAQDCMCSSAALTAALAACEWEDGAGGRNNSREQTAGNTA